jgi:hypothetical protein
VKDPVEEQIEEAISRGEFDHLPGRGQPLPKGDDGPGWWARKKIAELRREERVEAFSREIEARMGAIWLLAGEDEVRAAVEGLNQEIASFGAGPEPIDPESTLMVWRRMWRMRET